MKEGKKNDYQDGKLRWDLLPLEEIEDIVKLYTAGSIKYGDNNWQNLENGYHRYKAAMLRHLLEYEKGNKVDDETKVNHLAAVAWNAIAMLYLDKHGKGKDYDINDQELAKIVRDRIPVTIDNKQFIIESNPIGSCDGCYFLNRNCPTLARRYCCSNGGNILILEKQNKK